MWLPNYLTDLKPDYPALAAYLGHAVATACLTRYLEDASASVHF